MIRLAIYDMDRTITRRPTFTPFLIHAALTLSPLRLLLIPFVGVTIVLYALRLIDRGRLKEWNQALLVGRAIDAARLAAVGRSFAAKTMANYIRPGALRQIAIDKAKGNRLVMATASYRLYAGAIADALGFDDVIATNSVVGPDTRIMARIDGENCYGPAKLRMVTAWMHDAGIVRSDALIRFYSDHVSDAPVLEWADVAIAVNPHRRLRELAIRMGWPTVDW